MSYAIGNTPGVPSLTISLIILMLMAQSVSAQSVSVSLKINQPCCPGHWLIEFSNMGLHWAIGQFIGFADHKVTSTHWVLLHSLVYNSPTQFVPWSTSLPPGTDCGMYEALFGYNSVTGTVVPCIGTSFAWSGTGDYITIELNSKAKWSDHDQNLPGRQRHRFFQNQNIRLRARKPDCLQWDRGGPA